MSTMPAGSSLSIQLPLPIAPPVSGDVDLHAISVPARTFTGDFFFSHRVGNTLWVTVGDVAGKGLNAAVVMAMIQEELEHRITSCASAACDPAITMHRLHELVRPALYPNRFATIAIVQIRDDGRLLVANAGHPPPLIARRNGRIDSIGATGPAAGILDNSRWTSVAHHLGAGETLLLYTDGAFEGNDFGIPALENAFRHAASLESSRRVANAVAGAVHAHGGVSDDLTLVVARR